MRLFRVVSLVIALSLFTSISTSYSEESTSEAEAAAQAAADAAEEAVRQAIAAAEAAAQAAQAAADAAEEAARQAAAAEEAARLAAEEEAARLAAQEAERIAREEAERIARENQMSTPSVLDCSTPENMTQLACQPAMLALTNPDGSINCANPINTVTSTCMTVFQSAQNGELNCSLPELQNLPACFGKTPAPGPINPPPVADPIPEVTSPSIPEQKPIETPKVELPLKPVVEAPVTTPNTTVSNPLPVTSNNPTKQEENFKEAEGEEEPVSASLQVKFNSATNRYVLRIDSNLIGENVIVRATKKGSKTIRFRIETDEDGVGGIQTKTKLNGYTLTLLFNGETLSKVKVQ